MCAQQQSELARFIKQGQDAESKVRDEVRALRYGDCLEARSLAELLLDPGIKQHASLLLRSVVEVYGAQAGDLLRRTFDGRFRARRKPASRFGFMDARHYQAQRKYATVRLAGGGYAFTNRQSVCTRDQDCSGEVLCMLTEGRV